MRRTVSAFARNENIADILVCVRPEDEEAVRRELKSFCNVRLCRGGETRTASVRNALETLAALPAPPDYVLIHDAARPYVSQKIIDDCVQTVRSHGSAVCALPCTDTLVRAKFGRIAGSIDRADAYALQTPQGFGFADLCAAYRKIQPNENFTDDSSVYAKYVAPPCLFPGDRRNVKLTFREDFAMDETRTGIGADTHAFGAGDHIVLGGVRIAHCRGLLAHSDGDVLVHAVMDALLSAAGLADIGHYFPDTDPQYEGANSLALLARVRELLAGEGFAVGNLSAAIVAEQPKIAPHVNKMKANLAEALQIPAQNVGITAGTNEGLGYLGRGEGITAIASVQIRTIS